MPEKPPKKHGIAHLIATLAYSFGGLRFLAKETAFRHEVLLLLCAYGAFFLKNALFSQYVLLTILWLIIIGFEALNTAIELIIDHISPEYSQFAKHAKDLGSFSVSTAIISFLFYTGFVLFPF